MTVTITPTNFIVSPTLAAQADMLTFTWEWDKTPINENESLSGFRGFMIECINPQDGKVVQSVSTGATLNNPSYTIPFRGMPVDPYYLEYHVYATDNTDRDILLGGPSNSVRVYDSRKPDTSDPPVATSGARLEQFQNSTGAEIYPRTIVEGVFRQSDGKSLEDILSDAGQGSEGQQGPKGDKGDTGATGPQGPAGPGVASGGTAGQALVKKSGTDYDTQWATLIRCGTTDLTAGSSALAAGTLYGVY